MLKFASLEEPDNFQPMGTGKRSRLAPESLPAIQRRMRLLRRAVCLERGLPDKQADFCREMGLSPQTWGNYEVGAAGRPRIDAAIELSRQLEIPTLVSWIYQ